MILINACCVKIISRLRSLNNYKTLFLSHVLQMRMREFRSGLAGCIGSGSPMGLQSKMLAWATDERLTGSDSKRAQSYR